MASSGPGPNFRSWRNLAVEGGQQLSIQPPRTNGSWSFICRKSGRSGSAGEKTSLHADVPPAGSSC